jgi:hypothetical protein
MSQKHESIEGREATLRTELAPAIEARDLAVSHVTRIRIASERGKVLLDGAEQKVAELEASAARLNDIRPQRPNSFEPA